MSGFGPDYSDFASADFVSSIRLLDSHHSRSSSRRENLSTPWVVHCNQPATIFLSMQDVRRFPGHCNGLTRRICAAKVPAAHVECDIPSFDYFLRLRGEGRLERDKPGECFPKLN